LSGLYQHCIQGWIADQVIVDNGPRLGLSS